MHPKWQAHKTHPRLSMIKLLKVSKRENLTSRGGRPRGIHSLLTTTKAPTESPGDKPLSPPQPQGQLLDLFPSMTWANQIFNPICVILSLSDSTRILPRVNLIKMSDHVEGSWVETFKHLNQY